MTIDDHDKMAVAATAVGAGRVCDVCALCAECVCVWFVCVCGLCVCVLF